MDIELDCQFYLTLKSWYEVLVHVLWRVFPSLTFISTKEFNMEQ